MTDFLQRHNSTIFVTAVIGYLVSLGLWLLWAIIIIMLLGYVPKIVSYPAYFTTILYPILVFGSLLVGWLFHRRKQFVKTFWVIVIPLLYSPVMILVGYIAMLNRF